MKWHGYACAFLIREPYSIGTRCKRVKAGPFSSQTTHGEYSVQALHQRHYSKYHDVVAFQRFVIAMKALDTICLPVLSRGHSKCAVQNVFKKRHIFALCPWQYCTRKLGDGRPSVPSDTVSKPPTYLPFFALTYLSLCPNT